jgi:hypothetical protein
MAACRDVDGDLFFLRPEAKEPPAEAVEICDRCPVQAPCMRKAQDDDAVGVWAGTSYWQRKQLQRRYRRVICPVCRQAGGVVELNSGGQVCRWCAKSWRATPARSAQ